MAKRRHPWLVHAIALWLRPLLRLLARHEWSGTDKLPREGGYVLAPNHLSWLDPFTFALFQYSNGIPPRYLAKSSLFDLPVAGWILRTAKQIPVYRASGRAAEAFSAAIEAVESGEAIVMYPEGTMTRDPDVWPMTGKSGPVRVALETGRPLIPVAQWGPQDIWFPYDSIKKVRLWPRRTVRVVVGDPVDLSEFAGQELTPEVLSKATDLLMDAVTELLVEMRGERPHGPRLDSRVIVEAEAAEKERKRLAKDDKRRRRNEGGR